MDNNFENTKDATQSIYGEQLQNGEQSQNGMQVQYGEQTQYGMQPQYAEQLQYGVQSQFTEQQQYYGQPQYGAQNIYINQQQQPSMCCPNCGSNNLQVIQEQSSSGKDFSGTKGCCGAILFGPIGILCGACGKGRTITTNSYWLCHTCGNKFKL